MNYLTLSKNFEKCGHFIDGQLVEGEGSEIEIHSPYTGLKISVARETTPKELQHALTVAQTAQKKWSTTPLKERCIFLFKLREGLLREIDSLSQIISIESGKTHKEAHAEILKGIEVVEYALSLQNHDAGEKMEVSRNVFCEYRRIPLGIVACVTPFNFPAMIALWTIPIALALGNAVIWKPSEKTPITSNYLAKIFTDSLLPNGLFQILQGGSNLVEKFCENKLIKAISFVGSSRVAKVVYEKASQFHKRVLALGGAKNHIFLLPDAHIEMSALGIADSFTGCAGQRCMAASVLIAVGQVDKHIQEIIEQAKLKVLGKDMGALITLKQKEYLFDAIDKAEKNGAKIILDGRKNQVPAELKNGFWLGPTILDNIDPNSEAAQVELFGPILSIIRVQNLSEGLVIERASPYGNACSVFTSNGAHAEEIIRYSTSGMIGINVGVPVPREPFSFGGIGDSKFGHGDITGDGSLDFWSDQKKVTTKWQMQKDHNWMS